MNKIGRHKTERKRTGENKKIVGETNSKVNKSTSIRKRKKHGVEAKT